MAPRRAKRMTKVKLATMVHEEVGGLTKAKALSLVDEVFETIKECLGRGEVVSIADFGRFMLHDKRARRGRNPQTGEPIIVDGRRRVTFQYYAQLRSVLNSDSDAGPEQIERTGRGGR